MKALAEKANSEVVQSNTNAVTPVEMLRIAVEQNADLQKIERLMDLQERWEASQAKKAYMEAVSRFKKNPPVVIKDLINKQYNSRYSSLANMVNTVNKSLGEHDLNARWDFNQENTTVTVTCILSHSLGHSESVTLSAPPDTSGSKNPIQQIKSTITYLEGATFQAVTGVACHEPGQDDDGNRSGKNKNDDSFGGLSKEQIKNLKYAISMAGISEEQFLDKVSLQSISDLPQARYAGALKWLRDIRKGDLNENN